MNPITAKLISMQDTEYQTFQSRLMPTVAKEKIIGVRTPLLRKFAREIAGSREADEWLSHLPHTYYEENNLHAYLLERIFDFDVLIAETERFLPYIDNWATCDSFMPNAFKKNPQRLLPFIKDWIKSDRTYTVRYGIGLFMGIYLDALFDEEYPKLVAAVSSEEYYINMMIAWYFATALAKQENAILPYFTEKRLPPWIHNKAIQKAVESNRISPQMKTYLKTLRV